MNPFHQGSFCLQLKAFFNNGELTTSKADCCYKVTIIALGKKLFLVVNRNLPLFNYITEMTE